MINFGQHDPIASMLATLLLQIGDDLAQLVDHESPSAPKLVEYKGNPGRKRFMASLRHTGKMFNFQLNAKGFGLLARGMSYYGPNSVLLLLKFLTKKHIANQDFISRLSQAAEKCGAAYYGGQLSISN